MTPWPFAFTPAVVVGGAVYLLSGVTPIEGVYIDGRLVPGLQVTIDPGDEHLSAVLPLPGWVSPGRHRLRLRVDGRSFATQIKVSATAGVHTEPGARFVCRGFRNEDGIFLVENGAGRVDFRTWDPEQVGVMVRDVSGLRTFAIQRSNWSEQVYTRGREGNPFVLQIIYADGGVGERWQVSAGCDTGKVTALPGEGGIPLWLDPVPAAANPTEPAGPSTGAEPK